MTCFSCWVVHLRKFFLLLFNNLKNVFILGCARSLLPHRSFSLVEVGEGCSLLVVSFSFRGLLLLQSTVLGCMDFSSCSGWAKYLQLPGSTAQA